MAVHTTIDLRTDVDAALDEARRTGKLLFVDFNAAPA
jgi:hypothetical protein